MCGFGLRYALHPLGRLSVVPERPPFSGLPSLKNMPPIATARSRTQNACGSSARYQRVRWFVSWGLHAAI